MSETPEPEAAQVSQPLYGPAVRHHRTNAPVIAKRPGPEVIALRGGMGWLKVIAISFFSPIVLAGLSAGLFYRNSIGLAVASAIAAVLAIPLVPWYLGIPARLGTRKEGSRFARIPVAPGLVDHDLADAASREDYRREATARITRLVEDLIYDYGLMLTGQAPDIAYAAPAAITALRQNVAPALRAGHTIRPDFGNRVEVDIDWSPSDVSRPITASAVFVDQSTRVTGDGLGVRVPPRRLRLWVAFDHQLTQIIDASIGSA